MLIVILLCLFFPQQNIRQAIIAQQCKSIGVEVQEVVTAFDALDSVYSAIERNNFRFRANPRTGGIRADSLEQKIGCVFPLDFREFRYRYVVGKYTDSQQGADGNTHQILHISFFSPNGESHLPMCMADVSTYSGEVLYAYLTENGKVTLHELRQMTSALRRLDSPKELAAESE